MNFANIKTLRVTVELIFVQSIAEKPENKSKLASLGNPDELLTYLEKTYHAFKNVFFFARIISGCSSARAI